jgi:hypothetical protein
VKLLVDVRTVPRSLTNPQYNQDVLPQSLEPFGIGYEHLAALGGLRGRMREVGPEVNAFWENGRFHNHADYAMSARFREGLSHLRELGEMRAVPSCAQRRCGGAAIAAAIIAGPTYSRAADIARSHLSDGGGILLSNCVLFCIFLP